MKDVQDANFIAGQGIEDDRHASAKAERSDFQVLLMDQETLDALDLAPSVVRENVTTSGIDLSSLPSGRTVRLGDEVVLRISKPCPPCSRMDEVRSGLRRPVSVYRNWKRTLENPSAARQRHAWAPKGSCTLDPAPGA